MSPFADNPAAGVGALGELALLRSIRRWLGPAAPLSPHGMGDDTAVTTARANLLTVDSIAHGRHFDDGARPEQVGAKLLKRNLSDIAAMGGTPHDAVLALFLPRNTSLEWLEGFTRGLRDCALAHGTRISGGDLTETDGFLGGALTLTGFSERPLLRTGASIGAAVYVTGVLGGSIRGQHLDFAPRLAEGRFLAARPEVLSCIDVTDGLAKDLPALLGDGLAAALDVASLPASTASRELAADDPERLVDHILGDGEDYELLFTVDAAADYGAFEAAWRAGLSTPLTRIGKIVSRREPGISLLNARDGTPLRTRSGYEHFGQA